MNVRILGSILLILLMSGLTSCSAVILGLYGVKNPKFVQDKTIIQTARKYNIPSSDNYKLETGYLSYLFSLDTVQYKEEIKNHYQPLQALYYDSTGQVKSFQVNCYTGGFPNLKWNRNDIMNIFPPKQQAPIDNVLPLDTHLKFLVPLDRTKEIDPDNFEYLIIVHWNKFMGRQSKRFIRLIQENRKLAGDRKVKILYVNSDNLFSIE